VGPAEGRDGPMKTPPSPVETRLYAENRRLLKVLYKLVWLYGTSVNSQCMACRQSITDCVPPCEFAEARALVKER